MNHSNLIYVLETRDEHGNKEYHLTQKERQTIDKKIGMDFTTYVYKTLKDENVLCEDREVYFNHCVKCNKIPVNPNGNIIPDYRISVVLLNTFERIMPYHTMEPLNTEDRVIQMEKNIKLSMKKQEEEKKHESYLISALRLIKAGDTYFLVDDNSRVVFETLEKDYSGVPYPMTITYLTDILHPSRGIKMTNQNVEVTSLVKEEANRFKNNPIKFLEIQDYLTDEQKKAGIISYFELKVLIESLQETSVLKLAL